MDQINFEPWIDQTANRPGVLACGVKAAQSTAVKSADASYPEPRVKELILAMSEVGLTLRQDHLADGRWRWVFENAQIHSARREDGTLAVLILTNETPMTSVADAALAEFTSAAAEPETPAEVPQEPAVEAPPVAESETPPEAGQEMVTASLDEIAAGLLES